MKVDLDPELGFSCPEGRQVPREPEIFVGGTGRSRRIAAIGLKIFQGIDVPSAWQQLYPDTASVHPLQGAGKHAVAAPSNITENIIAITVFVKRDEAVTAVHGRYDCGVVGCEGMKRGGDQL
jgi:hypothetical protein